MLNVQLFGYKPQYIKKTLSLNLRSWESALEECINKIQTIERLNPSNNRWIGFIGSHLVQMMVNKHPNSKIINLDALTYASNLFSLEDCKYKSNYKFVKKDITNLKELKSLFEVYNFDSVIHLAAETHVDNSIKKPSKFIKTNVQGTFNLLETTHQYWGNNTKGKIFIIYLQMKFLEALNGRFF